MKQKTSFLIIIALLGATIATSSAGDRTADSKGEKLTVKQSAAKVQPENAIPGAEVKPAAFFYTGKPYDEDLGCYVFNYRSYSPSLNRWTATDPSGFPDGANNYSYVSNPLIACDPLGLVAALAYSSQTRTWTYSFSLAVYAGSNSNSSGPIIDSNTATRWKNAIVNTWKHTGVDKDDGGTLKFAVNITSFIYRSYNQGVSVGALSNSYDFVAQAAEGNYRSNVWNGNQGFWAAEASDLVIAHEAGHLMKARDFYVDVNGVSQPLPGWANTLMGAAQTPVTKDWNEVLGRNGKTAHLFE